MKMMQENSTVSKEEIMKKKLAMLLAATMLVT